MPRTRLPSILGRRQPTTTPRHQCTAQKTNTRSSVFYSDQIPLEASSVRDNLRYHEMQLAHHVRAQRSLVLAWPKAGVWLEKIKNLASRTATFMQIASSPPFQRALGCLSRFHQRAVLFLRTIFREAIHFSFLKTCQGI